MYVGCGESHADHSTVHSQVRALPRTFTSYAIHDGIGYSQCSVLDLTQALYWFSVLPFLSVWFTEPTFFECIFLFFVLFFCFFLYSGAAFAVDPLFFWGGWGGVGFIVMISCLTFCAEALLNHWCAQCWLRLFLWLARAILSQQKVV